MPTEIDVVQRRDPPARDRAGRAGEGNRCRGQGTARCDRKRARQSARERRTALTAQWKSEKEQIAKIRELKGQLEQRRGDAERFEREGDLGSAAAIRYGELPALDSQIDEATERLNDLQAHG